LEGGSCREVGSWCFPAAWRLSNGAKEETGERENIRRKEGGGVKQGRNLPRGVGKVSLENPPSAPGDERREGGLKITLTLSQTYFPRKNWGFKSASSRHRTSE